ncbi:hypothetical protein ACFV4K_02115 [Nocardia sp. NPDC059764]|uniref:hypothetical protein n=1 Tax=Nocardia sp. NPDC059764 TaxID=3346939 RepID=UPI0036633F79
MSIAGVQGGGDLAGHLGDDRLAGAARGGGGFGGDQDRGAEVGRLGGVLGVEEGRGGGQESPDRCLGGGVWRG